MAGLEGFTQGFGLADNFIKGREQNARQNKEMDLRKQTYDLQNTANQRKLDKDFGTQLVAAQMNGIDVDENDPQVADFYKRNPMMKISHLKDPATVSATEYAQGLAEGKGNLFSDETAQHIDALYRPLIQKDDGLTRRVAGVYPGKTPGTLALDLEVTDADGNTRNAPMTRRRNSDHDDEIMQIPITDLVNTAQATRSIQSSLIPKQQAMQDDQSGGLSVGQGQAQDQGQSGLTPNRLAFYKAIGMAPESKGYTTFTAENGSMYQRDQDGKISLVPTDKNNSGTMQEQNIRLLMNNGMSQEQAIATVFRQGGTKVSAADSEIAKLNARAEWYDKNKDNPVAQKLVGLGAGSTKAATPDEFDKRARAADEQNLQGEVRDTFILTGKLPGKAGAGSGKASSWGPGLETLQNKDTATLQSINGVVKELDLIQTRLADGTLKPNVLNNAMSTVKNKMGMSDEESANYADLLASKNKIRNLIVASFPGVATDSDAQRVMDELFDTADPKVLKQRIRSLTDQYVDRGLQGDLIIQQRQQDNNGRTWSPLDRFKLTSLAKYRAQREAAEGGGGTQASQPPGLAIAQRPEGMPSLNALEKQVDGSARVVISTQADYDALPNGARYRTADGSRNGVKQ